MHSSCITDSAEVGNKQSFDADTTFMVVQCLTCDSLKEDVKEGW